MARQGCKCTYARVSESDLHVQGPYTHPDKLAGHQEERGCACLWTPGNVYAVESHGSVGTPAAEGDVKGRVCHCKGI